MLFLNFFVLSLQLIHHRFRVLTRVLDDFHVDQSARIRPNDDEQCPLLDSYGTYLFVPGFDQLNNTESQVVIARFFVRSIRTDQGVVGIAFNWQSMEQHDRAALGLGHNCASVGRRLEANGRNFELLGNGTAIGPGTVANNTIYQMRLAWNASDVEFAVAPITDLAAPIVDISFAYENTSLLSTRPIALYMSNTDQLSFTEVLRSASIRRTRRK